MSNLISSLTEDGVLKTSVEFDEVTYTTNKFSQDGVYSNNFDETSSKLVWVNSNLKNVAQWQTRDFKVSNNYNWVQTALPTTTNWSSVTYGNGRFVAISVSSNVAAYSDDGINWIQSALPVSANWRSVAYGNGKFVAVGSTSNAYSDDGINWTQTPLASGVASGQSVTYGNGRFVSISSNTTIASYSNNGINWVRMTLPIAANWSSVTYGNGRFVAISIGATVAYSNDGINWSQSILPYRFVSWSSVTYGNGGFVAISNGSNVAAYSNDGITWVQYALPVSADWRSVTYGNGGFVAISNGSNVAAYSNDGITWVQYALPVSADWRSVTYGNGKFVAIGRTPTTAAYAITFIETHSLYVGGHFDEVTLNISEINIYNSIPNLVALYDFNENITNIKNSATYNLIVGYSCSYDYITGKYNKAIRFNNFGYCGSSAGLYCANSPWDLYNGTTDASFSFWIYLTQEISFQGGCASTIFGNNFGNFGFQVGFTLGQTNVLYYGLANTVAYEDTSPIPVGTWMHICGTWSSATKTFIVYKNGVKIIENNGIILSAPWQNFAGFGVNGSGGYEAGEYGLPIVFDTTALYNRTLSQEDVLKIYNQ